MEKRTKITFILLGAFIGAGLGTQYIPQLNFLWFSIMLVSGLLYFVKGKVW